MFRLYHSNDLEMLKGILLNQMQHNPPLPFEREAILVQSQGMSHWLKLQLADGLGVSAQVEFPLPSNFVWQVFNKLQPELPARSHFDKQLCAWKLLRLLPDLAVTPECSAIAHYLENDSSGLKCYQLAQTIADVFDQYLVYRPDWLLNWELGIDDIADGDVTLHPWQPFVWRALVADSLEQGHSLDHRARLLSNLESLVKQYPERLESLPKRLFVFGIAALPGSYWAVLQAISSVIDVHFFLLNPCRNFWGDIVNDYQRLAILKKQPEIALLLDTGNPLLASWGRLGRDFLTLVNDTAAEGSLQDFELWYADEERTATLLTYLQHDILNLHDGQQAAFSIAALNNSEFKRGISVNDQSIRLVSAHSPLREVQRLYDQILYWLNEDPTLKPRDIVVMVPDIDQYAPYIDAVFASHKATTNNGSAYHIPWAIADQSLAKENPIIDSFLRLLNLADSRLTITDIQDFLDVEAIRSRFELNEDDLDTLRDWMHRAEIRWGLDGDQRETLGFPNFEQNSWRKGLRQLLLGYMLPNSDQAFMDDYPVMAAEGNEGERLGKLMAFIDALEYWQGVFKQPALSVHAWIESIQQLLPNFYQLDGQEQISLQYIRDAMTAWQEELTLSGFNGELSIVVVRSWFNEQLNQQGGWQRFLAGPVNFCTLMPMRSIPFKAVCLLGMNDSDYPRRTTPVGFDLMVSGKTRKGDRARREDDRYLFLEAVTSAKEYLYISYRGHELRENAVLQPSVLLAELQDYLCDSFCLESDLNKPHDISRDLFKTWLIENLPLQPYNVQHFYANSARFVPSYQTLWAAVARAGLTQNQHSEQDFMLALPEELIHSPIQLNDVIKALEDPAKFFMRRRLQASLDHYWQEHDVSEPFALNALDQYLLKNEWLETVATLNNEQELSARAKAFALRQQALGQLPVNALGNVVGSDLMHEVQPLAQLRMRYMQNALASEKVEIQYENTVLVGEIHNAYQIDDTYLLQVRVGANRGRHYLKAWLQLVFFTLAKPGFISHVKLLSMPTKNSEKFLKVERLNAPSHEVALQQLDYIFRWYKACWQYPIAHYPDTLWQFLSVYQEALAVSDEEGAIVIEEGIQKIFDSESSELQSAYIERWLPKFLTQLNDDPMHWFEEYGHLIQALNDHLTEESMGE